MRKLLPNRMHLNEWARRMIYGGITAIVAVAFLLLSSDRGMAQYRLDSGDVIEISVFGVQDFKMRTIVSLDGNVSIPLLGEVHAAGMTITELRTTLKDALVKNNVIRNPDVVADVVQHRPFYINGDIARPGSHPFQPGLTVRHAVAVAGGYDVMRFKVDNPLIMAAELRSQYEALWTDYIRREARVTTLRAELGGMESLDLTALEEAPVAKRIIEELVKLEVDFFNTRKTDYRLEKEHLARTLEHATAQVSSLKMGREQELRGVEIQSETLARTSSLRDKGLAPISRLSEDQRAVALQKSRELETSARLAEAQRQTDTIARRAESLDDERRIKLLRELQEAVVDLEKVRAQLQGIGEKLLYIGAIRSQLRRGGRSEPEVSIYRKVDGKQKRLPSSEDSEVLPGDVIDIMFSQKQLLLSGGL